MVPEGGEPLRARGVATANQEIRVTEAARVLGLLDVTGLPERAAQWVVDGIGGSNVQALAGLVGVSEKDVPDGVRIALFEAIAADRGITFATLQEARGLHAIEIVRGMNAGAQLTEQIYGLSNGFTDELTARFRRFVVRLFRR